MKRTLEAALFFALLWSRWAAVFRSRSGRLLLPSPDQCRALHWELRGNGTLARRPLVTLRRLVPAATFFGVVIRTAPWAPTARLRVLTERLGWSHGVSYAAQLLWVPRPLLWFGQNRGPLCFVVVMGTLWSGEHRQPYNGFRTVPPIYARAARNHGSHACTPGLGSVNACRRRCPSCEFGMQQGWAFAWPRFP